MAETKHRTTLEIGVEDREVIGLGREIDNTFDPRRVEAFAEVIERAATHMSALADAQERVAAALDAATRGGGGAGGGGGGSPAAAGGVGGDISALLDALGGIREELKNQGKARKEVERETVRSLTRGMLGGIGGGIAGLGPAAMSGGMTAAVAGLIPIVGPAFAAAIGAANGYASEFAAQRQAEAGAFGATGLSWRDQEALVGEAVSAFGISPGSVPGMLASFAASSGLSGGRLGGGFGASLALEQLLGVRGGGSLIGAAETAGGRVSDPAQLLEDAVSAGVNSGFRVTRLDDFFSGVGSFMQRAATQGIPLDASSVLGMVQSFAATGSAFQGEAGLAAAEGISGALSRAGRGEGVFQGVALRSVGFGEPGGPSFMQARERLSRIAENPEYIANFVNQLRSMAPDADTGAYLIERAFRDLGHELSPTQARQLYEMGYSPVTEMGGAGAELLAERGARAGNIFGVGASTGGLARGRQRLGGAVFEDSQRIQRRDLSLTSRILPRALGAVDAGAQMVEDVFAAYQRDGMAGVWGYMRDTVGGSVGDAVADALPGGQRTREVSRDLTGSEMTIPAIVAAMGPGGAGLTDADVDRMADGMALIGALMTDNAATMRQVLGRYIQSNAAAEVGP